MWDRMLDRLSEKSNWRSWTLYAIALCAVSFLLYAPMGDHLLDTHDADYFADSEQSLSDPIGFFAVDKKMPGRPFFELLVLVEYALWGDNPRLFHWAGIALHALAAWTLAYCGRKVFPDWDGAKFTGFIFVCICAPFQAVQWISAHCYPLALILVCLSLWAWIRYIEARNSPALICALLALAGGILTHISAAIAVPFAAYIAFRRGVLYSVLSALSAMGLGAIGLVMAVKMLYAIAPQNSIAASGFDGWNIAENYLFLWGRLLRSAFWIPSRPDIVNSGEIALGAFAICGGIWITLRRKWDADYSVLWIALSLLPPLLLDPEYLRTIPAGPSRYLYLPSAGIACIVAQILIAGLDWVLTHSCVLLKRMVQTGVVVGFVVSSWNSLGRAEAVSYYTEGRNYLAEGEIRLGIEQLLHALGVKNGILNREDLYVRLCTSLINQGEDASAYLDEGRRLFPRNMVLNLYQRVLAAMAGDSPAIEYLNRLRESKNARAVGQCYYHVGRGAYRIGEYGRSVAAFSRALAFDPDNLDARQSLQGAQAAFHIFQLTISALDGEAKAVETLHEYGQNETVSPFIAEAYYHAGQGAFRRGEFLRSVTAFSRALSFDSNHIGARQSLSSAQAALRGE